MAWGTRMAIFRCVEPCFVECWRYLCHFWVGCALSAGILPCTTPRGSGLLDGRYSAFSVFLVFHAERFVPRSSAPSGARARHLKLPYPLRNEEDSHRQLHSQAPYQAPYRPSPQTIKPSCFNGSVWKSPPASNLQTRSEDFAIPALKTTTCHSNCGRWGRARLSDFCPLLSVR